MALTITLEPEIEARVRAEAQRTGLSAEELATQYLLERELLWSIRTAVPDQETRELHRLLRRRKAGTITPEEQVRLQTVLDERELRGAQRLEALGRLSRLKNVPVRLLMDQLGIRPISAP